MGEHVGIDADLARACARAASSVAVVEGGVQLTFAELDERASRVASHLRELGVRPGDRVCVVLGRTPELFTAALGTLKARAVYAPLVVCPVVRR